MLTQSQICNTFGDIHQYIRADGTISPKWESLILTTFDLPAPLPLAWNRAMKVQRVRCHKLVKPFFERALYAAYANPEIWATINDYGGFYMFRPQRNSNGKVLSTHSWGISLDIDCIDNPMGTSKPKVHPGLIKIFKAEGITYGGLFKGKRCDPQHWEFNSLALLPTTPQG